MISFILEKQYDAKQGLERSIKDKKHSLYCLLARQSGAKLTVNKQWNSCRVRDKEKGGLVI